MRPLFVSSGHACVLASELCPFVACCGAGPWHHEVKSLFSIAQPTTFILHARSSISLALILGPTIRPLQAHPMLEKLFRVYAGIIPQTVYCGVLSWEKRAGQSLSTMRPLWPCLQTLPAMCPPWPRLQTLSALRPLWPRLQTLSAFCPNWPRLQTLSAMCPPRVRHASALYPRVYVSGLATHPNFVHHVPTLCPPYLCLSVRCSLFIALCRPLFGSMSLCSIISSVSRSLYRAWLSLCPLFVRSPLHAVPLSALYAAHLHPVSCFPPLSGFLYLYSLSVFASTCVQVFTKGRALSLCSAGLRPNHLSLACAFIIFHAIRFLSVQMQIRASRLFEVYVDVIFGFNTLNLSKRFN